MLAWCGGCVHCVRNLCERGLSQVRVVGGDTDTVDVM